MNGEKQKFIGGIDFDELKAQRVQLYNTITVDLATARSNEEMVFTGNYIYALEATDVDANLDIRFNELFRAAINIKKGRGVRVPFYRLYITNTAQAGKTITLAIGIEASDFEVFDVGKALGITGKVAVYPSLDANRGTDASGRTVNPIADQVLVDTGPLVAGLYEIKAAFGTDTTVSQPILAHRNAANDADIWAQCVPTVGGRTNLISLKEQVDTNERIRFHTGTGMSAAVSALINWLKIAE